MTSMHWNIQLHLEFKNYKYTQNIFFCCMIVVTSCHVYIFIYYTIGPEDPFKKQLENKYFSTEVSVPCPFVWHWRGLVF